MFTEASIEDNLSQLKGKEFCEKSLKKCFPKEAIASFKLNKIDPDIADDDYNIYSVEVNKTEYCCIIVKDNVLIDFM